MKFQRPGRFTSFYESFSDLIFGTMAIFVLLMIVFLTMIKQDGGAKVPISALQEVQEKLKETQASLQEARGQAQDLLENNKDLEKAVRFSKLEMAIAVDTTGSMSEPLKTLRETVRTLAVVLPKMSPEFHVGVYAYSFDGTGTEIQVFPLSQVVPEETDRGASVVQLQHFVDGLEAKGGIATLQLALERAVGALQDTRDESTIQLLLVIGDVGPYEYTSAGNLITSTGSEAAQKDQMAFTLVQRWSEGHKQRRVATVFTATDPNQSRLYPNAGEVFTNSQAFFRKLPEIVGQPKNFTVNEGRMLALIIDAILRKDQ